MKTKNYILLGYLYCIILYVGAAIYAPTGIDIGSYIGISQKIVEGKIPFCDFPLYYAPVSFYLTQPIVFLFESTFIPIYLFFLYVIHFINAFFIYKIIYAITKKSNYAHFSAILFLLLVFCLEGYMYGLEAYVLLFSLPGLYLILTSRNYIKVVLSGVLIALSFLSKQYGLLFFPVGLLLILVSNSKEALNKKLIKAICFIAGFGLALGCFVAYYTSCIDFITLIKMLTGSVNKYDYGQRSGGRMIGGILELLSLVAPVIVYLIKIKKEDLNLEFIEKNKYSLLGLFGLCLAGFQFYIEVYFHYYIIALPFIFIAFSGVIVNNDKTFNTIIKNWMLILLVISGTITLLLQVHFYKKYDRDYKIEIANKIKEIGKETDEIYLDSGMHDLYFLSKKTPPEFEKYGFFFYQGYHPEDIERFKRNSKLIVTRDANFLSENQLENYQIFKVHDVFLLKKEENNIQN